MNISIRKILPMIPLCIILFEMKENVMKCIQDLTIVIVTHTIQLKAELKYRTEKS